MWANELTSFYQLLFVLGLFDHLKQSHLVILFNCRHHNLDSIHYVCVISKGKKRHKVYYKNVKEKDVYYC